MALQNPTGSTAGDDSESELKIVIYNPDNQTKDISLK
jgi:hypothetical protein